jgi:hypothetical protein
MTTKKFFSLFIGFQFLFVQLVWSTPQSAAYRDVTQALSAVGAKGGKPLNIQAFEKKLKSQPQMYERFRGIIDILKRQSSMNLEMSSFEKDGQVYPRIGIRLGADVMHMEFYGEPERFIRFEEVTFLQSDFDDPDFFFQKLMTNSHKLRKRMVQQMLRSPLEMTPEVWNYLTPHDQAMFMINLRLVHDAATDVLDKFRVKHRATTGIERLFINEANAEDLDADGPTPENGACIVGGWESVYKDGKCSENVSDLKGTSGFNLSCPNNGFACRPILFGMNGSNPHCISRSRNVINFATRECSKLAPITSEEDREKVKKTLESLMKVRGAGQGPAFTQEEVSKLVLGYNSDIEKAVTVCSVAQPIDPNQKGNENAACDVLNRRKLDLQFVMDTLGVKAAETPAGKAEPGVLGNCPAPAPAAGGGTPAPGGAATPGGVIGDPGCLPQPPALGGTPPGSTPGGPVPGGSTSQASKSNEPGFFSKMWKLMKDNKGILIGGALLIGTGIGIYLLSKPKKVKSNPLTYVPPAAPPNTGSAVPLPITTNNACCLINGVWVRDSNGCQGRLNVTSVSTTLSLCGSGGSIQTKAISKPITKPAVQSKPGRR